MTTSPTTPKWARFEHAFSSTVLYANPFQDVLLTVELMAPNGQTRVVEAFWNGGLEWRVRFMPDQIGHWVFRTSCSDPSNHGLHGQSGRFYCCEPEEGARFDQHGAISVSTDRRFLTHADGTPFFWLADTAWNGPLCATPDEWTHYLAVRKRQKISVVQWVATQWLSAPHGDWTGELPYSGHERITLHPTFFQRLDQKIAAMNRAGILSAIVMLWAATWRNDDVNARNPGFALPEDQAIKLARYMRARWEAFHIVWFLNGDGDYRGERSERWKQIGRAVFNDDHHAPVSLHPGGRQWIVDEFRDEPWMNFVGYQSGHGDDDASFDWLLNGPPATDWKNQPSRPFINVELPYEGHVSHSRDRKHDDASVRRAIYWSLLITPTAGVTYGGHGVWGWDDGSAPPIAHPKTGTPLNWREALVMPGAEQLPYVSDLFLSVDWWALQPSPELLTKQPGHDRMAAWITVAQSAHVVIAYLPDNTGVDFNLAAISPIAGAHWFNPRSGGRQPAAWQTQSTQIRFNVPQPGDWVLLITKQRDGR